MFFSSLRRFPFFRLLLAAFVGFIWVRSHYKSDILALFVRHGRAQIAASDRGRAIFAVTNISFGDQRSYTYDHIAVPNDEFADTRALVDETPPLPAKVTGVLLGASGETPFNNVLPGAKYHYVAMPFWMPAVLAGLPLLWGLRTFWHRRRWGMPGVCAACGYDLRASSGRCPECGETIPERSATKGAL